MTELTNYGPHILLELGFDSRPAQPDPSIGAAASYAWAYSQNPNGPWQRLGQRPNARAMQVESTSTLQISICDQSNTSHGWRVVMGWLPGELASSDQASSPFPNPGFSPGNSFTWVWWASTKTQADQEAPALGQTGAVVSLTGSTPYPEGLPLILEGDWELLFRLVLIGQDSARVGGVEARRFKVDPEMAVGPPNK